MVEVADVCERNSGGFPGGEVEAGGSGSQTATPEAVKQRSLELYHEKSRSSYGMITVRRLEITDEWCEGWA